MLVGHRLEFCCQFCESNVNFSVLEKEQFSGVNCPSCGHKYIFDDETLVKQLKQFEALCRQIHASQNILGRASIAVDIGTHRVKLPFNLLLTRLSSVIDLEMGGKKMSIAFRVEPLKDFPFTHTSKTDSVEH